MIDQPNFMQQYGERLIDNGYRIVPIAPGSKVPSEYNPQTGQWYPMRNWQRFLQNDPTAFYLKMWVKWPGCGIGVLTGPVVGIDIDILDSEYVRRAFTIIERRLGRCQLVRVGLAPKMMMVYQTDAPFKKIDLKPLECLGDGQQFVAYGIHPVTGKPYDWGMDSLVDMPIDRLTMVTEEDVKAAINEVYSILPDELKASHTDKIIDFDRPEPTPKTPEELRGTPELVAFAAENIANVHQNYKRWNIIGMAIFNASGGADWGRDLFFAYSARHACNSPDVNAKQWRGYISNPPKSNGVQNLIGMLKDEGTPIPLEIPFTEIKRAAQDVDISGMLAHKIEVEELVDEETLVSADAVVESAPLGKPLVGEIKAPIISEEMRQAFPMEWLDTSNGSLVSASCEWILQTAMYPQPSLTLANVLVMMAGIFGRNYHFDGLHMNLMALGLTESGGGKETSLRGTTSIIYGLEFPGMIEGRNNIHHLNGPTDFTSGSAVIETLYNSPSIVCNMNEFGKILTAITNKRTAQPHQAAVGTEFLKLYSDAGGCAVSKAYAHSKENPIKRIWYPNLCVYGASTISTFTPALSRTEMESGLLSRILLIPALENVPKRKKRAPLELPASLKFHMEQAIIASRAGCENLENGPEARPKLKPIDIDDDATVMLEDIMDRQDVLKNMVGGEIWIRWAENTSKIAMIEAVCVNPERPVITREIMARSIRLVEWSLRYTEQLFEREVSDNEHQEKYKKLLKIIREAGDAGITKSGLQRKTQWMAPHERDKWMADLIESGQVTITTEKAAKTTGRAPQFYRIGK